MATKKNKEKTDPSTTSMAYQAMTPRWTKINALLGGTEAMRAGERNLLPQHPNESNDNYSVRLASAVLLNMTELTLESWVGRPFSDDIVLNEDVPEQIEALLEDVDMQGNNLQVFARRWFREGLAKAFAHIMVEFPRTEPKTDAEGKPVTRTLADDQAAKLRPYWVAIPVENVIFAHAEVIDGVERVTHMRVQEEVIERDGFAEVCRSLIRVYEPGRVEVWEYKQNQNKKTEWVKIEEYTYDLPYIPLVTFYAAREAPFLGKSPLTDLADLNIRHWQSYSDQANVLTVARFPMLAGSGVADEDKFVVGPKKLLFSADEKSKFYYVEHTGAAIASGDADLRNLEDQMSQYGAEFLRKRPGGETATARALDSAEATSPLQDVVVRFEDALNRALQITADWLKIKEGGGTVKVNKEFGPEKVDASDLDTLNKARDRRDISRPAYLEELKRRGVLVEEFDPEEDKAELEAETAEMVKTMEALDPAEPPEEEPPVAA